MIAVAGGKFIGHSLLSTPGKSSLSVTIECAAVHPRPPLRADCFVNWRNIAVTLIDRVASAMAGYRQPGLVTFWRGQVSFSEDG